jgi:hypothetical protein
MNSLIASRVVETPCYCVSLVTLSLMLLSYVWHLYTLKTLSNNMIFTFDLFIYFKEIRNLRGEKVYFSYLDIYHFCCTLFILDFLNFPKVLLRLHRISFKEGLLEMNSLRFPSSRLSLVYFHFWRVFLLDIKLGNQFWVWHWEKQGGLLLHLHSHFPSCQFLCV